MTAPKSSVSYLPGIIATRTMQFLAALFVCLATCAILGAAEFSSSWRGSRTWIGPEFWANPLQDWRVEDGEIVARVAEGRTLHLLTGQVEKEFGSLTCRVRVKLAPGLPTDSWAGFAVGIQGALPDYRNALIFGGKRISCGLRADGRLLVGHALSEDAIKGGGEVLLTLAVATRDSNAEIVLTAEQSGRSISVRTQALAASLRGNIALATGGTGTGTLQPANKAGEAREAGKKVAGKKSRGEKRAGVEGKQKKSPPTGAGAAGDCRFRDWSVAGTLLTSHPDQTFGPILWSQYTLSRRVLKLSAQFPPLGPADATRARLEILRDGIWREIASSDIHPLARVATFRVAGWDDTRDIPYRVAYSWQGADSHWNGTVRRDPVERREFVAAVFTCEYGYVFPQSRLTRMVAAQNPDLLYFSGDQIYEQVGGFGVARTGPLETRMLDYLRKYYQFGWQWRELLRDRPSVITPDDHDVFQGNLWGAGGRRLPEARWEEGGYFMPVEWVNAVQMTQTSHLPDPVDPATAGEGIGVFFTDLVHGRISFAVVEDRKFKSPPRLLTERGINPRTIEDPARIDIPGASLLGERQEAFLRRWTADWTGADMKCVLSQTAYCKVTTHAGNTCTPDAPMKPPTDRDLDCGGWPQSARNRALDIMRRGFAIIFSGDQHNSAVVHLGIDAWEDAGVMALTGATSVGFPRAWWPDHSGENHQPGRAEWTGRYVDGLGNRMTVLAAGNMDRGPADLLERIHNPEKLGRAKGSGHAIARFDKTARTITIEQWRLGSDPSHPRPDDQFPDYPVVVRQEDCYGRTAAAWLPEVVSVEENPVVQVVDESTGEIVYTLRAAGTRYRPKVFHPGRYTVIVGEGGRRRILSGLEARRDP